MACKFQKEQETHTEHAKQVLLDMKLKKRLQKLKIVSQKTKSELPSNSQDFQRKEKERNSFSRFTTYLEFRNIPISEDQIRKKAKEICKKMHGPEFLIFLEEIFNLSEKKIKVYFMEAKILDAERKLLVSEGQLKTANAIRERAELGLQQVNMIMKHTYRLI